MRRTDHLKALILFISLMVALGGGWCFLYNTSELKAQGIKEEIDAYQSLTEIITDNDKKTDGIQETTKIVEFNSDTTSTTYNITSGGDFLLKGKLYGSIQIDAGDEIVHLILDGVTVRADAGPAVFIRSAGKVVITVKEGTENSFRDSTNYDDFKDYKSCVFSNTDLTINGSGDLFIYGDYRDAIRSRGVIKVMDTCLKIRAKDDGLRGNDGILLLPVQLSIDCEGTGIITENSKRNNGNIEIGNGQISITAGKYGLDSANDISIIDSNVNIYGVLSDYIAKGAIYKDHNNYGRD